jgi:WD40 repeat protein
MVDTLLQVINDSPVSPRQVNPAIDRDLETICLKCLEKTASRRYLTAQDLSDELQRFIDGHPIEARPVGVLSRVWRWSCRRPKLAAAWSTVAALLLFLSIAGPLAAIYQTQLKTAANQSAQDSLQSAAKYRKEQIRANAKATEAEHALYDTRMILAQSALENNNPGYTRQLLALYEGPSTGNDYRGFEWHYLNQQVHQEICSINPHPGFAIMDVATPPSREVRGIDLRNESPVFEIFEFATLGGDGFLRIWQIDGTMKREVSLGPSGGYCMDYKNDGQLIVVGSKSGEIRFFDVKTLEQKKQVKVGLDDIFDIDLCPPNDWGEMCIVRNNKGAILSLNLETDDVKMIAPALTLRDGRPLQEEFGGQRRRFACSSDGNYLAFNDEIRGKDVAVWDLKLSKLKYVVRGTGSTPSFVAPALALSADGGLLVNGDSRGEISVWRPSDGVSQLRYHDHSTFIEQVTITLDDRFIVSAGRDRTIRTTEILGHKKRQVFYGHETHVVCFAVAPNNEFIVSADRAGELKVFSLTGMSNPRKYFTGNERGLAFNPLDASYALANSNTPPTIEIWDKGAQRPTRTLDGHLNKVRCLSFHPRGTELAAGLNDGTIYIWNPGTGESLRAWKAHESSIQSLAHAPNGTRLASISFDNQLKIWDSNTGELVQQMPYPFMIGSRLSWNDDGTRIVAGTLNGRSTVIDVASGKTVLVLPGGSGIYTPDGKQILYVEVPDGKRTNGKHIIACDALTGKEKRRFVGHIMRIDDVIITADSQRAISIDKEKRIAVWNMNTGAQICKLRGTDGDYNPSKLHIGPDGRTLAYQGYHTAVWSTGKIAEPSQDEVSH